MKSRFSMLKSIAVAAALAAGVSGIARADDSSMSRFGGDSYAYFNGGNLPQGGPPVINRTPSTFRQTSPHGLPFSTYQALSSPNAPEWQPAPVIDYTASTFHQQNPHGLPFSTYQALASPAPMLPTAKASSSSRVGRPCSAPAASADATAIRSRAVIGSALRCGAGATPPRRRVR